MDFYLMRHSQTDFNELGYYQGCLLNPPLNDYGVSQTLKLVDKVAELRVDKVYSSPLRRAYGTAKLLFPWLTNHNLYIRSDLIEGDFGIIEGMREVDIREKYPEDFAKWKDLDNMWFNFPNGQSKGEIGCRMYNALYDIHQTSLLSNRVFIVTHSASIRCLLLNMGIKEENIPFGTLYHITTDGTARDPLQFVERIVL